MPDSAEDALRELGLLSEPTDVPSAKATFSSPEDRALETLNSILGVTAATASQVNLGRVRLTDANGWVFEWIATAPDQLVYLGDCETHGKLAYHLSSPGELADAVEDHCPHPLHERLRISREA